MGQWIMLYDFANISRLSLTHWLERPERDTEEQAEVLWNPGKDRAVPIKPPHRMTDMPASA